MTKTLTTLVAEVLKIIYNIPSFCIFLFKPLLGEENLKTPIKGVYSENSLSKKDNSENSIFYPGQKLILTGYFEKNKYGEQFTVISFNYLPQTYDSGIISFLKNEVKGIGEITAEKMFNAFGDKLTEILDNYQNYKEQLRELGITKKRLKEILKSWNQVRNNVEILPHLYKLGLTPAQARMALKQLGANCVTKIKNNPYILTQLKGIGFLKADKIANTVGINPLSKNRIKEALKYILNEAALKEGHCFLYQEELYKKLKELIPHVSEKLFSSVLKNSKKEIIGINNRIYLTYMYTIEKSVVNCLLERAYNLSLLAKYKSFIEKELNGNSFLTDQQKSAVYTSLTTSQISYITGLPGTGKTTTVKSLVELLEKIGLKYELAAPTGKAARRLSEQTYREAKTIHRLLEFKPLKREEIAKKLQKLDTTLDNIELFLQPTRNRENPIEADVIIVDEASMIDIFLIKKLLDALAPSTLLILVGDPNQLPPVGPGSVFKDIVSYEFFQGGRLTKIIRQEEGSIITTLAHLVHKGVYPSFMRKNNKTKFKDFVFINIENSKENNNAVNHKILEKILQVWEKTKGEDGETQVLSCINKGILGVNNLNNNIRALYFGREVSNENFLPNDRVIQIENNYEKMVFNGEIGSIINLNRKNIDIQFEDKVATYNFTEAKQLNFAYCLTVHRAQGSEYDTVILPLTTSHFVMLTRNLLYTAITRAKRKLYLIGARKAFYMALKNQLENKRNSCIF